MQSPPSLSLRGAHTQTHCPMPLQESSMHIAPGVSVIFKIRVFFKARIEGFEFFIRWPYAVFHKMQVVFYKSAHFMYL